MSDSKPFVHLHLHTKYSLLDGACHIDQLMDAAIQNNMPAMAITDHGVMYGCVDFFQTAKAKGIKPIIGCEAYITSGCRLDRGTEASRSSTNHIVLLAMNDTGYHNLIKLISLGHLEGVYYKPRIDKEILAQYSEGILGMSACLNGEIASYLQDNNVDAAIEATGRYSDIFGKDNFYLELMDHGLPEQRKVNVLLKKVSAATNIPFVATNDVHYLKKEHAAAHEVLLCMQTQTVMSDPKRMRYRTQEFYLKSHDQMASLFADFPGALDRTLEIAEKCNLEMTFGKLHFPTFETPGKISQKEYLIRLCLAGVTKLYNIKDPLHPKSDREKKILDRFNMELGVIEKTGFVNYFLVVWDFVRFAREKGIPVGPGRGSGGGSLMAYVLGITTIDPLKYDLIFERFLNPQRVSPPDFDIDFCQARRGEVIEYVKEKYGRDSVAQIITFGSLGAKMVIRDVGRALEVPYSECDKLSKMVPDDPKIKLRRALEVSPELKEAYKDNASCKSILDYGFVLEGLYRNPGTHAAGVVIGEKPLIDIIPLARDKEKQTITQYAMEAIGEIGLLKMDFLGLKTLTVLHEAVELIKQTEDIEIDLNALPEDDKPTYDLLNRGDTVGVFQLESSGMRDLIRRVGIDALEDLIAMIALYRPGPMNMLDDYVNRKTGKAKIKPLHPMLNDILQETYGVMLYQEQVQKAANILAGYSLGEADILRRAMGKKKQSIMDKQRTKFVDGCAKVNKINASTAGRVFDTIAKFAGYGFNKAHSAGYAIIAYQTAYLKANYPAEFMAALLSSEIGNFDKIPRFISEANEMGMTIHGPDVNASGVRFLPGDKAVRFGLAGIKNVGQGAAEAIVKEREDNGPYSSLVDLCSRVDSQEANRKVLESLVRCGGADELDSHRAKLFNGIDFAMARAADALRDRLSGQGNLFDMLDDKSANDATNNLPDCEEWHENRLLTGEKELLGLYMSGHPLTQYANLLDKYQLASIETLCDVEDKEVTRVGGIISQLKKRITKTSKPMAIIQLENIEGTVEVVVFPDTYQKYGAQLAEETAVLVCGEVSRKEEQAKIIAQEIYSLADTPRLFSLHVSLHIPVAHSEKGRLEKIRDILQMHPGETPVIICLQFPKGEKVFMDTDSSFAVLPDEELLHELEHELGEHSVYVAANPKPCRKPKPQKIWEKR
ncbi:MAG: DNA polymerase III subunit alpha [Kiritimatiellae bacterium]|nr:DNA polymerase III subunit alpha [Kiritimatiellia bacterium]